MTKLILTLLIMLAVSSANAAVQTVTLSWDLYKDDSVSSYAASNYEIQVLCRKNTAALANVKKVPATTTTTTVSVDLVEGDTYACVVKAHRLSDDKWSSPSTEASLSIPLPTPSAPTGLKAVIAAIIGFFKAIFGWLA